MEPGQILTNLDVAQVCVYVFIAFFIALVLYLRREDKREGYPLVSDRSGHVMVRGFPDLPEPKRFETPEGHVSFAPAPEKDVRREGLRPLAPWPGAPSVPTGDPMKDGVGPASWANRMDEPELTWEGEPAIQPLSVVDGTFVAPGDANPIGMEVIGADNRVAGVVREIWTDRSEPQIRYLEVEVTGTGAEGAAGQNVLVPMGFARIHGRRGLVKVRALLASQFAGVPPIKDKTTITKLEEDKITGYFAGGTLYATPQRLGPVL